jgi:RNA polymerase sigma-70 factor (ECF subfamily)
MERSAAERPPIAPSVEELVAAHQSALIRYARRLVRNEETAQDIAQEAFLRYVRASREADPPRAASTWLFRVAHNLCIDLIRKESRMREGLEQMDPPATVAPPASEEMVAAETRQTLDRMLERLTDNQRTVLVLKMQEGKSYREISEITGLSVSNVGFLIHRGLKRMGEFLRQEETIR